MNDGANATTDARAAQRTEANGAGRVGPIAIAIAIGADPT